MTVSRYLLSRFPVPAIPSVSEGSWYRGLGTGPLILRVSGPEDKKSTWGFLKESLCGAGFPACRFWMLHEWQAGKPAPHTDCACLGPFQQPFPPMSILGIGSALYFRTESAHGGAKCATQLLHSRYCLPLAGSVRDVRAQRTKISRPSPLLRSPNHKLMRLWSGARGRFPSDPMDNYLQPPSEARISHSTRSE